MARIERTRVYNWYVQVIWLTTIATADLRRYISLVAASCMVLYGYDASVYNAVQGSDNWVAYFDNPDANIIGAVNTSYSKCKA